MSAVWAGGLDGGSWIDCREVPGVGPIELDCAVFDDHAGSLEAKGRYVERRITWDAAAEKPVFVAAPPRKRGTPLPAMAGWDGDLIFLQDQLALVPTGWIEHPGAKKRGLYQGGVLVKETNPSGTGE